MTLPIIVKFFRKLPKARPMDDPEMWASKMRTAIQEFARKVNQRYEEGTLLRLLQLNHSESKRAAILALGMNGSYAVNGLLSKTLHDKDQVTAALAAESLWEIWFRAGTKEQNELLKKILTLPDPQKKIEALSQLAMEATGFAEVINQRAILYYQIGEYHKSIADCVRVLEINPYHFGAQAGMGECYLKIHKPKLALQSFRLALQINPTMTELHSIIRDIQRLVDESID